MADDEVDSLVATPESAEPAGPAPGASCRANAGAAAARKGYSGLELTSSPGNARPSAIDALAEGSFRPAPKKAPICPPWLRKWWKDSEYANDVRSFLGILTVILLIMTFWKSVPFVLNFAFC